MKLWIIVIFFIISLTAFSTTFEEGSSKLEELFTDTKAEYSEIFHKSFLDAISENQIKEIILDYKNKLGDFQYIAAKEGSYEIIGKKAKTEAKITINEDNLIVGLWFGNVVLINDTIDDIIEEFKYIDGNLSLYVLKNNKDVIVKYKENKPMAVGSAFKLFVLKALNEKIKQKKARWDTVVKLNKNDFSLPSGFLQNWDDDTPLTLKTLANLMISISDNTATDTLISYLGRNYVEKFLPERIKPLLKTTEMFKLKWGVETIVKQSYINSSSDEKRKILKNIETVDINKVKLQYQPTLINEIEWFLTTKELCEVIYEIKDNSSLRISNNLGIKRNKWNLFAFKGGSEPGVLNLTYLIRKTEYSDYYCISITVNNEEKEAETRKLVELAGRLVVLIENEEM